MPITFRVVDADGRPVTDPTVPSLRTTLADCSSSAVLQPPVPATASGASGLQDLGDGWWQYNWKTDKAWAGTCRALTIDLAGGDSTVLHFALR